MKNKLKALGITHAKIERAARFLTERYGVEAEEVALARIAECGVHGKAEAAAIWGLVRMEIRDLKEGDADVY